jgi:hypothetical protein
MTSWETYCDTQEPAAQVVWLAESLTHGYWPGRLTGLHRGNIRAGRADLIRQMR